VETRPSANWMAFPESLYWGLRYVGIGDAGLLGRVCRGPLPRPGVGSWATTPRVPEQGQAGQGMQAGRQAGKTGKQAGRQAGRCWDGEFAFAATARHRRILIACSVFNGNKLLRTCAEWGNAVLLTS
jgi:hypothetical protein